jgi:hypothetical protein
MTDGTFRTEDGCLLAYEEVGEVMPILWQHWSGSEKLSLRGRGVLASASRDWQCHDPLVHPGVNLGLRHMGDNAE